MCLSDVFAKLRKANINLTMFVCPSVRTEQLLSQCTVFYYISYLNIFRKSVEKFGFHKYRTRIMDNLQGNLRKVMIISH